VEATRVTLAARTVLAGLLLALALPAVAAAVEPVDVTGTVTDGAGAPAGGVEVALLVAGTDVILSATTDPGGAFAIAAEAAVGDTLELRATGATVTTGPDEEGCVHSSTPFGKLSVVIEALPLDPVVIAMDQELTGVVCQATATPRPHAAKPTPPATDRATAEPMRSTVGGLAILLGLLSLAAAVSLVASRRHV
jgi:hypothetical protein